MRVQALCCNFPVFASQASVLAAFYSGLVGSAGQSIVPTATALAAGENEWPLRTTGGPADLCALAQPDPGSEVLIHDILDLPGRRR